MSWVGESETEKGLMSARDWFRLRQFLAEIATTTSSNLVNTFEYRWRTCCDAEHNHLKTSELLQHHSNKFLLLNRNIVQLFVGAEHCGRRN